MAAVKLGETENFPTIAQPPMLQNTVKDFELFEKRMTWVETSLE